jgi:hypothetical protein
MGNNAARPFVRALMVRLVPIVSSRPWLVALAARVFARAPWLKHLVRHFVSTPPASQVLPSDMTPLQAGVLSDLQEALQRVHGAQR